MNEHQEQHYLAVVNYLRQQLAARQLPEGQPLPSAHRLSEQLGFGEKPVQDALESLATIGILENDGRDYQFSEDMGIAVSNLIDLMLLANHFTYQHLSHLRRYFELSALPRIIQNMNDGIRGDLQSALLHMKMAEIPNPQPDSNFHRRLLAASGNPLVTCISDAISHAMELEIAAVDQTGLELTWHEMVTVHEKIFLALCESDLAAAERAINTHYDMVDRQLSHIHQ